MKVQASAPFLYQQRQRQRRMSSSSDDDNDDDDDLGRHKSSSDDDDQDHNHYDLPSPPFLPNFHPENGDQLILLRLPAEIPLESLGKVTVSNANHSLELQHPDYTIQNGHASQHASMRMLVPSSSYSSDKQLSLGPSFSQICTVSTESSTDNPASSSSTQYPPLQLDRKAYGHVPQKAHLKRRWRPLGCHTSVALTSTTEPKRAKLAPSSPTADTNHHDTTNDTSEKRKSHKKKKKKKKKHKKEHKHE